MVDRSMTANQFKQAVGKQNEKLTLLPDDLTLSKPGFDPSCIAIAGARLKNLSGFGPFSTREETDFPAALNLMTKVHENAQQ